MQFPRHIYLSIDHQPHAVNYESVEDWLAHMKLNDSEMDREEMIRTGEVWSVQWYPDTPVGFCIVAAATLERALELANASGD